MSIESLYPYAEMMEFRKNNPEYSMIKVSGYIRICRVCYLMANHRDKPDINPHKHSSSCYDGENVNWNLCPGLNADIGFELQAWHGQPSYILYFPTDDALQLGNLNYTKERKISDKILQEVESGLILGPKQMQEFCREFDEGRCFHKRFGQAFCCRFKHFVPYPRRELFYHEEDRKKAEAMAWEHVSYSHLADYLE